MAAVRERAGERAAELRRPAATRKTPLARHAQALAEAHERIRTSRAELDAAHQRCRDDASAVPILGETAFAALHRSRPPADEDTAPETLAHACLTLAHHARTLANLPHPAARRARLHELRVHAEHTAAALNALVRLTRPALPRAEVTAPPRPGRPRLPVASLRPLIVRTPAAVPDLDPAELRAAYRADRAIMRMLWHRSWWTCATPGDITGAWEATTRWAGTGSRYAATTLVHLRGRIRQYTGLDIPPPADPPGPDLSHLLATGHVYPPHGDTAWWRCTVHDRDRLLTASREPATPWELPQDVAARVHADQEHLHEAAPDLLLRLRITTAPDGHTRIEPTRIDGSDIDRIRTEAARRDNDAHHIARHATLMLQDLDARWRPTATHTELVALRREVHTWTAGPARDHVTGFLE